MLLDLYMAAQSPHQCSRNNAEKAIGDFLIEYDSLTFCSIFTILNRYSPGSEYFRRHGLRQWLLGLLDKHSVNRGFSEKQVRLQVVG